MITENIWPFSQICLGCKSAVFVPMGFGDSAYVCTKAMEADGEDCPGRVEATDEEWQAKF